MFLILTAFLALNSDVDASCSPNWSEPTKPTCFDTSEACLDAWYQFGDQTGDYGVIDAEDI